MFFLDPAGARRDLKPEIQLRISDLEKPLTPALSPGYRGEAERLSVVAAACRSGALAGAARGRDGGDVAAAGSGRANGPAALGAILGVHQGDDGVADVRLLRGV